MESRAVQLLFDNILHLSESSNGSSIQISSIVTQRIKRKRQILLASKKQQTRKDLPEAIDFWKVISKMPDDVFSSHFGMKIGTFKALKKMLEPLWPKKDTGRPCLPLTKSMYLTLWKLSNPNSFRELSERFGVGTTTAYRSFFKIIKVICLLKNSVIAFPSTDLSQKDTMEEFQSSLEHAFPYVLGCIDGTHIRISQPVKDGFNYCNRQGTYSVVVQAVVDSKMRFLDAFVGYPGNCDTASVWRNSPLRKAIVTKGINIPSECHLLGNAAYPLETFLMTPYKDNGYLTEEEKKFNFVLSSTRVVVEQAFGFLKKKFRILNYIENQNIALTKQIIMACLVVHNVIIDNEKPNVKDEAYMDENICESFNPDNEECTSTDSHTEEAKMKRNRLTMFLSA